MTKIIIYRNDENMCVGFRALGHAGYAEQGEDIVCSAISILTINTINAIQKFTSVKTNVSFDEEEGFMEFQICDHPTKETTLLMDTMILGFQTMVDDQTYRKYIDLKFEEV